MVIIITDVNYPAFLILQISSIKDALSPDINQIPAKR